MRVRALDDLDCPAASVGRGLGCDRPLVASVGKDALDEREGAPRLLQNQARTVAVLNIGGMHDNSQEEAERVDEDVPLAPRNLLARVIALRIKRIPPFGAALALWLSMIAAVGLASRPACSRTAT
jgi:hypothetical protein